MALLAAARLRFCVAPCSSQQTIEYATFDVTIHSDFRTMSYQNDQHVVKACFPVHFFGFGPQVDCLLQL